MVSKETPQVFVCIRFENFESISKHRLIHTNFEGLQIPLNAILLEKNDNDAHDAQIIS
jgi:hypothetical protein